MKIKRTKPKKLDQNFQRVKLLHGKLQKDKSIQEILELREKGWLTRPSYNLKTTPELSVTQLSNLK